MFADINRLHIHGRDFTQNINLNNRDDNILKHLAFQSLPRASEAAFSAAINLDNLARRPCTKGTRVDILAQITAWINEKDVPPVYWLTGLAGLGKTTIAYTICKSLEEARIPFASFFCSLQLDSKNSKLIVTTLCRDLAEIYGSYAANLLSTLETNSKAVHAGLRIQIDELLAKPWQASIAQGEASVTLTPIIIVDALDENDRGTEFLEELLRIIQAGQLTGIKFLVTSRPEPKIVNICKSFPPNAVCKLHEVDTTNVQNDIEKYLREALPELKDDPGLAALSERAGGFFIYATTAVRFISPPHSPFAVSEMRSHLQAMLNPDALVLHADTDERLLVDELYERILGDAFRNERVRATRLRILHTIICAESGINISVLADLTETEPDVVEKVVESLHAVLFVSPKDGNVYWYHASFPDFVFSQTRARFTIPLRHQNYHVIDVFCDAPVHHEILARRCFSVIRESLHFNMCSLPSSYVFDSEVSGLNLSINKTFSPTLQYSSMHWARHLRRAAPPKGETDDLYCALNGFLCDKLLFWIEAMNLIGGKYECSSLLKDAECWLEGGTKWTNLREQLKDAANFSIFFAGSPASRSTPHLYISALSVWNHNLGIWRDWRERFRFIPSISLPLGTIKIPLLTIHTPGVESIAFSPDSSRIVTGSHDKSVRVWDAMTGELMRELQGHAGAVRSVAFSPDGNRIVSGSSDKSVRVWDAKTGEELRKLQGHTKPVILVAFSSDGNRIVSGFHDTFRIWDAKTGEQLRVLEEATREIESAAVSPDGNQIICTSSDKFQVWDAKTDELRLIQPQKSHTLFSSIAFSPDSKQIVSGSWDESVQVWDVYTGEELRELQGHTSIVDVVAFSPDGNRIISGSSDKSVRVWDAKTGEQLRELQGHISDVTSVAFSPDGNRIISSCCNKLQVWDAKTEEPLSRLRGHTDSVKSVAFSPDGNQIVTGSDDKSVRVWDAKTGEQLKELQEHSSDVQSVAFSLDGNLIMSHSNGGSMRVWDAHTGKQLRVLEGDACAAFSLDGNRIVSSFRSVQVWDGQTGEHLKKFQEHPTSVGTAVAFSPDGNRIVSGYDDNSVRVWDAKTGELLRDLQGHSFIMFAQYASPKKLDWPRQKFPGHSVARVTSVAFSSDGNRIVCGSENQSVAVWDVKLGRLFMIMQGHTGKVTSVAFSSDGNRILSGSVDKSVRVWDVKTGNQLRELQGHTDEVNSVAFSPDGNQIVSGSEDNTVRVWNNLNLDPSWVINEDGWILSGEERLAWVPSSISYVLLRPHSSLIISRHGSATISFTECKLGTLWHGCYTP